MINLTQHTATPEQVTHGVVEPADRATLVALLTFDSLPTREEINHRAKEIAKLAAASGYDQAMIGGAPYLMGALESALYAVNITPFYAFSERKSTEQIMADGSVKKVNIFVHQGFIRA